MHVKGKTPDANEEESLLNAAKKIWQKTEKACM